MGTNLRNKKVLITSGPTWVAIDNVRVISNTASGQTGILLAKEFALQGAKVTLLMGPVGKMARLNDKIELKRFSFFKELDTLLNKELKSNYDIVIQAAAISDYAPKFPRRKKISSQGKILKLTLKRTPKIINCLRKTKPDAFLVGFKFEPDLSTRKLITEAGNLIKEAGLNLAVANTLSQKRYKAYLVNTKDNYGPFFTKAAMARNLIKLIRREYARD